MRSLRGRSKASPSSSADSTTPAESPFEIVWMKMTRDRKRLAAAENASISRSFHLLQSTGRGSEDCYTFEHFARRTAVLRSTYYYHYKRSSLGLKEEAKWS
jgi:hypothetical protein